MRSLLFLALLLCLNNCFAHQLSTAYLNLVVDEHGVARGDLQVRFYDLERALYIDVNRDGKLRWQELLDHQAVVNNYLSSHLVLSSAGQTCALTINRDLRVDQHFNEGYLVVPLQAQCSPSAELSVVYSAFFAQAPKHKLLLQVTAGASNHSRVLDNTSATLVIPLAEENLWQNVREFIYQGVLHIWLGLDHIAFLITLLLTSVLLRKQGQWQAEPNGKRVLINATWIASAFTLAHSLTLTLTALGVINLPSRWVEVGIALSIAFAAMNNIFPLISRIGALTLAFGLLHGMGFAGVLSELTLPKENRLAIIVAFNLGVEIGQLAILLVVMPFLLWARNYLWYRRYTLPGVSSLVILLATYWVAERL